MSGLHVSPGKPFLARRRVFAACRAAFLLAAAVEALPAQGSGVLTVERFDSVVPPALPAGWRSSRHRNPLRDDFESSASAAQSPPNALVSANASISQELISPALSFVDRTPGTLSFSLRRSATHDAGVLVEASTDGGGEFALVIGDTLRPSGEATYRTSALPLPAFLAGYPEIHFRWRTIAGSDGTSGTLRIDDVVITADPVRDIAIASVRCEPAPARMSNPVRASVRVAGVGIERLPDVGILLGTDGDGDGNLSGTEIWAHATLALAPGRGETTGVDLEFHAPDPGEYPLLAIVDSPRDQGPDNNRFLFSFVSGYRLHAVVVNEIMYAPAAEEPEWIELRNTDTSDIPLSRWKVGDSGSPEGKEIAAVPAIVPAGGLVVIARSASALAVIRPECDSGSIDMSDLPSLNNSGDCIVLRDHAGIIIDSVCYLPGWGGLLGRSLERKDDRGRSDDASNWGSCVDSGGATPCRRNSIAVLDTDLALATCMKGVLTAGEQATFWVTLRNDGRATVDSAGVDCVEFREDAPGGGMELLLARGVMRSPLGRGESTAVSLVWEEPAGGLHHLRFRLRVPGDARISNDTLGLWALVVYRDPVLRVSEIMAVPRQGEAEYVEVLNAGREVIDLAGWTITESPLASGKAFALSRRSLCIVPGASFVLASDSTLFHYFAVCDTQLVAVAGTGSLQLNNDADIVVLRDASGRAVDSVAYTALWHSPVLADPVGRSLERISAGLPSSDARNWGTSVARSGGTPGCPNSIRHDGVVAASHLAAHPNPFSPDGDGWEDHTTICFEVPRAYGWMSMRIFDVCGRMVRFLTNNEPCGRGGAVVWDGFDDGRKRVRIGIYIILLEVADQDRETLLTARGSVVVAGKLR